jgi:hypothetical protein
VKRHFGLSPNPPEGVSSLRLLETTPEDKSNPLPFSGGFYQLGSLNRLWTLLWSWFHRLGDLYIRCAVRMREKAARSYSDDPFVALVPDYADKVALAFVVLFFASVAAFVVAFYLALSRFS